MKSEVTINFKDIQDAKDFVRLCFDLNEAGYLTDTRTDYLMSILNRTEKWSITLEE